MNIEKHTSIDCEYFLITDIDELFAKTYCLADAKLIAQSKRMFFVLKRILLLNKITSEYERKLRKIIKAIEQ